MPKPNKHAFGSKAQAQAQISLIRKRNTQMKHVTADARTDALTCTISTSDRDTGTITRTKFAAYSPAGAVNFRSSQQNYQKESTKCTSDLATDTIQTHGYTTNFCTGSKKKTRPGQVSSQARYKIQHATVLMCLHKRYQSQSCTGTQVRSGKFEIVVDHLQNIAQAQQELLCSNMMYARVCMFLIYHLNDPATLKSLQ